MAVARLYGPALKGLALGRFNLASDTFKCALFASSYVPNVDSHEWLSDCTGEVTGTGYTTGGATLSGLAAAWSPSAQAALLTCNPAAWSTATISGVRVAVIYKVGATAADSPLLSYVDFGSDQSVTGANLQITFPVGGFAQINRL